MKGGEHQPPPREVLTALEKQDRAGPDHRFEAGAAAGRQAVLATLVERSDHLGVRDHHHRRLEAEEGHAEGLAVTAPARVHELDRAKQPADGLDGRGRRWSWGKRHCGEDPTSAHATSSLTQAAVSDILRQSPPPAASSARALLPLFLHLRELRRPDAPPAEHLDLLTRYAGRDVGFLAAQPTMQRRQGGQPDRGGDG